MLIPMLIDTPPELNGAETNARMIQIQNPRVAARSASFAFSMVGQNKLFHNPSVGREGPDKPSVDISTRVAQ